MDAVSFMRGGKAVVEGGRRGKHHLAGFCFFLARLHCSNHAVNASPTRRGLALYMGDEEGMPQVNITSGLRLVSGSRCMIL